MKYLAPLIIALALTGCGITPEMITGAREDVATAQQVVDDAQDALDDLRDNPEADAEEVAQAEEVLNTAREILTRADTELAAIEADESPEAGIVQAIGTALGSATGQPWFYIAGVGIAGLIRERRRASIAKADSVALAKSVQPAIDAANPETKQRIRDLQDGQKGIRKIVTAATD